MDIMPIYPGTFSPPTWGHVSVARRAAEIFEQVVIICSQNPEKQERWFTPEECREMWLAYPLPRNIVIKTFKEFTSQKCDPDSLVMIRGLRNKKDFADEKKIAFFNNQRYGISKFFYLKCESGLQDISSTAARAAAKKKNIKLLSKLVSPLIISKLLEKVTTMEDPTKISNQINEHAKGEKSWIFEKDGKNYANASAPSATLTTHSIRF